MADEATEQQQEATVEAPAGPDLTAFNERFDQFGAQMQEIMARLPEPQPQEDPAEPEFDWNQYDETDPAQAQALLQALVDQRLTAAVQPLLDRLETVAANTDGIQRQADAQMLEQEFPALREPEVAQDVLARTAELAQQIGRPELFNSVPLIRHVYLAGRGSEYADAEVAAGNQAQNALEDAAGGVPGGSESNLADRLRAGRGQVNPYFGFVTRST